MTRRHGEAAGVGRESSIRHVTPGQTHRLIYVAPSARMSRYALTIALMCFAARFPQERCVVCAAPRQPAVFSFLHYRGSATAETSRGIVNPHPPHTHQTSPRKVCVIERSQVSQWNEPGNSGSMWINSLLNQLFCIKHIEVGERESAEQPK